ncbi:dephospho-CoA kinase [Mycoplana sp. BE70]|uniref:dephospho-CoA kinase n=1 Tax=Mycoplana sp. BE70 TaxID=2817775 RepID=UPI00285B6F2F|nr:dephospho-CoA kinase [Mycoplana sp. BE70]MDR6755892.1 dephospho-CoA kinase [Mycoplana sp. BE70]
MIVLGLTGSIGTGKSTTAEMFRSLGVPVHDADATVHALYRNEAVGPVGAAFPDVIEDGAVDRKALAAHLAARPEDFKRLEAIIHPLVREKENAFLEAQRAAGAPLVVLDIPLLFETGGDRRVDKTVVVTCGPETQRRRVLARPGMTEEKFAMLLARQVPDAEKRARADLVVNTDNGLEDAREQVELTVESLTKGNGADA